MPNDKVDLSPYLNNSLLSRFSDGLYRTIFQPISDFADWAKRLWTRHFCESNIPPNERV